MDLHPAIRLNIYEFIPICTNFAVAHRDEYSTPVIVFVRGFVERDILATCKTIRDEIEAYPAILDRETMEYGPSQS
jgi:hypothetical protein